jgi:glycosyltransferase involved in cell wall biosynthesis
MVSLIVATVNRVAELERLLSSLDRQTYRDFEVIVVDQNADDRLAEVLQDHSGLHVRHLRCDRGAGRARNHGLRVASGDVICFPDDDCWYPQTLLQSVMSWLEQNREFNAVFTTMRSADNRPVGPRWPPGPCSINRTNVWDIGVCVTAFLKRQITDSVGFFRDDIGVGASTPYQSGEETDYYLRALEMGLRARYEPSLTVYHPDLHGIKRLRMVTYPYALGFGYVMRIHGYSRREFGAHLLRSLGGALMSLGKGNLEMAHVYVLRASGQLRGYLCGPRDLSRLRSRID